MCGAVASTFCFGGGKEIPASPPLLSRAGGMQAHSSVLAPGGSLVGVLAAGRSDLHLHLRLGQFSPWGASDYFAASVAPGL